MAWDAVGYPGRGRGGREARLSPESPTSRVIGGRKTVNHKGHPFDCFALLSRSGQVVEHGGKTAEPYVNLYPRCFKARHLWPPGYFFFGESFLVPGFGFSG